MKKNIAIVLIACTFLVSACTTYMCPTYSKGPVKNTVKKTNT